MRKPLVYASPKKPLVYVAGPYSVPDPVLNTHRAIRAGMKLYETGRVAVIIPHLSLLAHMVIPRDVEFWYRFDIDQLDHCHALLRIPGESVGADNEVERMVSRGKPVFFTQRPEWPPDPGFLNLMDWVTSWEQYERQRQ